MILFIIEDKKLFIIFRINSFRAVIITSRGVIMDELNKQLKNMSNELRKLGYAEASIVHRQKYWREYYIFMQGSFNIDETTMDDFLLKIHSLEKNNINISKHQYEVKAAIRNLFELKTYGKIVSYHTPWLKNMPWVKPYKSVSTEFLKSLSDKGNKSETVKNYERTLKKLTCFLHTAKVKSFAEITPSHITDFLVNSINGNTHNFTSLLCHLRVFFRYLYLNEHNAVDLSLFIPKSNILLKRKHIPTTWTREDVSRILACIDIANPCGKRDYAMILLVARLGLRVSDIISLKFENIRWDKNCISISQYKTNEPLVLPLFDDVGNAIIDYIKNGRPITDNTNIFVKHIPPFEKFSVNNHLYGIFNKYLQKSGIVITPEKNHGMHSLRHTLANELLRNEIPLPVISEILGHKSLETTMQYLRADTEQLRYCTLIEGENYAAKTDQA